LKKETTHVLVAIPSRDDSSRYHLGLELAKPKIEVSKPKIKTTVWRVLSLYPWDEDVNYPWDEDVKDFKNPVV
jgi:hypothetical protein